MTEIRKATSWKKRYAELKEKYDKLVDMKIINSDDKTQTPTSTSGETKEEINAPESDKKEVGSVKSPVSPSPQTLTKKEEPQSEEITSPQSVEEVAEEKLKQVKETPAEPLTEPQSEEKEEVEENIEEELEVEKEPEEEEINPDDYKYCCPSCKELFNELKEGRCPSCNEELDGAD